MPNESIFYFSSCKKHHWVMKKLFRLLPILLISLLWTSCKEETSKKETLATDVDSLVKEKTKTVEKAITLLPPPEQILSVMESETPVLNKYLFAVKYANEINDPQKVASAMGIYLTDLSYLTMHNQMQDALLYMEALQKLAVKLRVEDIFSAAVLNKAQKYKENPDSIKSFVAQMYGKLLHKLRQTEQEELIDFITFSAWNEAVYLTSKFLPESKNKQYLSDKLAEQKLLLTIISEDLKTEALKPYLEKYQKAYEDVKVEYQKASEIQEDENVIIIKNKNKVLYDKDDLVKIEATSETVRRQLVSI